MRFLKNTFVLLFPFAVFAVMAQTSIGHPYLDSFQGQGGILEKSQIWHITSGLDGYVFFASNDGLGVFDGVRWELIPSKENLIIRCLYFDPNTNTLFCGAVNQIGKWTQNHFGQFEYTPLWKNTKSNSTLEFWRVVSPSSKSKDVYFQSHQSILKLNTISQHITSINARKPFKYMSVNNGNIYVQEGDNLCRIDNNQQLMPIVSIEDRIINVYQNLQGELVLFLEHKGVFRLSKTNQLIALNATTNDILKKSKLFSCTFDSNGHFLIGTTQNGLYVLDNEGNITQNIGEKEGLPSTTVLSVSADKDHNIWMGLDGGVALLNQGLSERFYSPSPIIGNIHSILKVGGQMFIGTNQGLFELKANGQCAFIKGTTGPVWSMYDIAGKLIFTHDLGVFSLEHNLPVCIKSGGVTSLARSTTDLNDFISSDYYGLGYYKLIKGKLTYISKVKNFEGKIRRIQFDKYGYLWTILPRKGFVRIVLSDDKKQVKYIKNYHLRTDISSNLLIASLDGNLVFFDGKVAFRYDIRLDNLVQDKYANAVFQLCGSNLTHFCQFENIFWYQAPNDIGYVTRDGNHLKKSSGIFSCIYNKRIEPTIAKLDSSTYTIGYQNGISFYQMRNNLEDSIKIRMIEAYGVGEKILYDFNKSYFHLPYNKHYVNIYPTHLNADKVIDYRVLELDTIWHTQKIESNLTITSFESGTYTVQLRNSGDNRHVAEVVIKVDRPWYFSNWMIISYALCSILIVGSIVWYFKRKNEKDKLRIEQSKRQKLEELEKHNLKQTQRISELEKEKLKIELHEKDKQLAIITMNGVKRNNMLIDIKNDITTLVQSDSVALTSIAGKHAIKKIEKELDSKEDWNIFEQYFNTIFDGLLDRLATKYPQLSHADLKLCAYLKLNLNNKEIADLLNISYRSVEMAKYRLRKKLLLEPKDNFSTILNITKRTDIN